MYRKFRQKKKDGSEKKRTLRTDRARIVISTGFWQSLRPHLPRPLPQSGGGVSRINMRTRLMRTVVGKTKLAAQCEKEACSPTEVATRQPRTHTKQNVMHPHKTTDQSHQARDHTPRIHEPETAKRRQQQQQQPNTQLRRRMSHPTRKKCTARGQKTCWGKPEHNMPNNTVVPASSVANTTITLATPPRPSASFLTAST